MRRYNPVHNDYILQMLAQLYLVEWRMNGLLPWHEGLLLVRE